eukprot:393232_1
MYYIKLTTQTNEFCNNQTLLPYVDIIFIICLLCGLFITYLGIKGFCIVREDIQFPFKFGFMLQCIAQLIGVSVQIIIFISCQTLSDNIHVQNWISFSGTFAATFIYFLQIWILECLMICRLYYTFNHSVYRIQKYTLIILIISVFIEVLISLSGILLFFIFDQIQISILISTVGTLMYIVMSTIVMILFVSKIYNVSIYAYKSLSVSQFNSSTCSHKDSLKKTPNINEPLVTTKTNKSATKYMTLGLIGFGSTFMAAIATSLINFITAHSLVFQVVGIMWTIDSLCNLLCIFLQYSFSKRYYYASCDCIDRKCRNLFVRKIEDKLSMDTKECEQ